MSLNLGGSNPVKFVGMMSLGWPWPFYGKVKFSNLVFCMGKKIKQWIFFWFYCSLLGWLKPYYMLSLCGVGNESCGANLGHVTNMAVIHIYSKNHLKIIFTVLKGRWPYNSVYSIGGSGPTKLFQMVTLGWLWPFLCQGQILSLQHNSIWLGKGQNSGFFWNYHICSLWHQSWFIQLAKWTLINTNGQGHLLTLVLCPSV